jgi:hypothetical protein
MHKFSKFILSVILAGVVVVQVVGCSERAPTPTIPAPDLYQTQIALSNQLLLEQRQASAPTLTALSQSILFAATLQARPSATSVVVASEEPDAILPASSPVPIGPATPTPGFSQRATQDGLQATINAALPTFFATTSVQPPLEWTSQPPEQTSPVPLVRGGRLALSPPTPYTLASSLLYNDDFSEMRGWFVADSGRYFLDYVDGAYRIYVKNASNPVWSVRSVTYDDVRLEVDAVQQAGPTDGYFGLVCRLVDSDNYYMLVASFNGDLAIARVQDKKLIYLNYTSQTPPRLRLLGNRLRADCVDRTLSLYLDGVKVIEATDDQFGSGYTGLAAGDRTISGTDILFDNFVVIQP